jgi:soluble lytic murein transglycosylase
VGASCNLRRAARGVALAWFQQAGVEATNDFQREWWVRAALRAGDWQAVQRVIESMGEATRTQPVWRYWRARALQAGGQRVAANAIFLDLSREHHYYGQLAQEELGPVAQAPVINIKMGGDDVTAISRQPGIARALALYELGLRSDASLEWNWTIRGFPTPNCLRLPNWRRMEVLIRHQHRRAHSKCMISVRFAPTANGARLRENQIVEAWVFGLMRRKVVYQRRRPASVHPA